MPYLIFIRHGKKEYKNNKGPKGKPKHDPGLDSFISNRNIIQKTFSYFYEYGFPNKIISSPFLRTRLTSKIIKHSLDTNVEIIIDKEIEEYLGHQNPKGELADLDKETEKYTQPKIGVEHFENIQKRILNFYNKIKNSQENIIIVTHGILIAKLAQHFDVNISHIKELEGIIIKDNKCYHIK